jgi:hypothetical protein
MRNFAQLILYCFWIVIQPIRTATHIVRDRNAKTGYFAIWLALVSLILYMSLFTQSVVSRLENEGISHSAAVMTYYLFMFVMIPVTFFVYRFLFVAMTKGGLRILSKSTYPAKQQDRLYASDTLRLVYPYLYVPTAIEMLILLVTKPSSFLMFVVLQVIAFIYTLILQIVFIKQIYRVSGIVAFFAPLIVGWITILVFGVIWLITTGSIFVLFHYT